MQAAAGNKRKVRAVRLVLPRFDFPLEVKGATQGSWVPESGRPFQALPSLTSHCRLKIATRAL